MPRPMAPVPITPTFLIFMFFSIHPSWGPEPTIRQGQVRAADTRWLIPIELDGAETLHV